MTASSATVRPLALVVDDHPVNRFHASELLAALGWKSCPAANAAEALSLARDHEFGLILMDLEMPDCDGITLLEYMRRDLADALPLVIGLTAAGPEQRSGFLRHGLYDCLEKPLLKSDLAVILNQTSNSYCVQTDQQSAKDQETVPFDWEECLQLASGRCEHAREMLTIMLETLVPCLEQIQSAAAQRETRRIREQVHYLAGACRYCSAPRLRRVCSCIEQELAPSGSGSLRRLPQLFGAAEEFAQCAGDALVLLNRVAQFERDSITTNASA